MIYHFLSLVPTAATTSAAATEICHICYSLPLAALAILTLIAIMIITIVSYFVWDLRQRRVTPVETAISLAEKKEKVPASQP